MNYATHRYTTDEGTVYVRMVVDREDGTSTARVVSDQRRVDSYYTPGDQVVVPTDALQKV